MSLLWDPEEAKSRVYQEVEKHSDGMISFTYRPPSASDLEALKGTKTYSKLMLEDPTVLVRNTEENSSLIIPAASALAEH